MLGHRVATAMELILQEAAGHPVRVRGLFRTRGELEGPWAHTLTESGTSHEEVIQMVASGYSGGDIATHLKVPPGTLQELLERAFFPTPETSAILSVLFAALLASVGRAISGGRRTND
jgi:hypothetical protein